MGLSGSRPPPKCLTQMTRVGGMRSTLSRYSKPMQSAAKIPNALMGRISLIAVARKAAAVVRLVRRTALEARKAAYSMRLSRSSGSMPGSELDCLNASTKTKTSSAPMPSSTNTARMCMKEKKRIWNTKRYTKNASGMDRMISSIPTAEMKTDRVCNAMYVATQSMLRTAQRKSCWESSFISIRAAPSDQYRTSTSPLGARPSLIRAGRRKRLSSPRWGCKSTSTLLRKSSYTSWACWLRSLRGRSYPARGAPSGIMDRT